MKAITDLARDALALPARQRITLARILLDLSETDPEEFSPEAEPLWEEEICRRMKAVEAGTAEARPLQEVFADLDRRFPE
jgi:hypothetical protein